MKVGDKDYNFTDLFKLVQSGLRFQKDPIFQKDDKDAIVRKWLENSDIRPGPYQNKAVACYGHYVQYCDNNKVDTKLRRALTGVSKILTQKFDYKQHGSTRLYEMNKDLSEYEKKDDK